jgi:hypothetical protein
MSERSRSRLVRLRSADTIIVGGAILLFLDSFLEWQGDANAWGGDATFAGVLMALFALLVVATGIIDALGMVMPAAIPLSTVVTGLTVGAAVFGLIKFLFVVANHVRAGAWIGLALILVVSYGVYAKIRAERIGRLPSGFTDRPPT